jgi:hypothetical protein
MMRFAAVAALVAFSVVLSPSAQAVTLGQVDTFEASIENWFAGGGPFGAVPPIPPSVVASGGPGGADDAYLQVTSNGSAGPGGRLVAMNGAQWAGDYLAAGVGGIAMDLRNFGTSDLTLRLLFEDPMAGAPPANLAATTFEVTLLAGGDWTHVVFPIAPTDLTVLMGDASTLLSNTTLIRLYHGTDAAFPGERIAGLLGVDNIAAVGAVPEPAALTLMLTGLALFGARRAVRAPS